MTRLAQYKGLVLETTPGNKIDLRTSSGLRLDATLVSINADPSTGDTTIVIDSTDYGLEAIDINETAPLISIMAESVITVKSLISQPTETAVGYTVSVERSIPSR